MHSVVHWHVSYNLCFSVTQWTSAVYVCQKSISPSFEIVPQMHTGKDASSLCIQA